MTLTRDTLGRCVLVPFGIVTAWFAIVAGLTVVVEPTRSVIAVAPLATIFRAAAASDVTVVEVHPGFSRLQADRQGFVADLYRNGVWFVWPGIDGGCISP